MRSKHEIPTASVGSSQAPTDAVEISALRSTRQTSTYRRPFRVQTNGATSPFEDMDERSVVVAEFSRCESENGAAYLPVAGSTA